MNADDLVKKGPVTSRHVIGAFFEHVLKARQGVLLLLGGRGHAVFPFSVGGWW